MQWIACSVGQYIQVACSGIHCIHSGSSSQCCIDSTALNLDAWNPLHSIGINFTMLQGIHCIQSGSIAACCMDSTAFNLDTLPHAACNPLHSLGMHFTLLHGPSAFNHTAWNPLHSIGINYTKLHGIRFIQWRYIAPL